MVFIQHATHAVSFLALAVVELPSHAEEVALALGSTTSFPAAILLGCLYGSLVALAPDHLGTVMTLSAGSTDAEAFRVGGAWGLGHSAGMGLVFMTFYAVEHVFGLSSEGWETYSDYAVGVSMILCALYFIVREKQYIKENADGTQTLVACDCCAPIQLAPKPELCVRVGTPPARNYNTFGQGVQSFNPRVKSAFGQGVQSYNPRLNSGFGQGVQIFSPKVSGGLGQSFAPKFSSVSKGSQGSSSKDRGQSGKSAKGLSSSRTTSTQLSDDVDLEEGDEKPSTPPRAEEPPASPLPRGGGPSAGGGRKNPPLPTAAAASSAAEGGKTGRATMCFPVGTKDSGTLIKKKGQRDSPASDVERGPKQGGDEVMGSDAPAALTCPNAAGMQLFGWSHRDVNGAIVGTVQGFCCPMCLVGASFASVLNTPARCAVFVVAFVVMSVIVTGLLALVWSRIARSGSHWVSSKIVYRATCTFTLCLGVVWIIANYLGEVNLLEWTKHLKNV